VLSNDGSSLVEILISLFLLSFILLGFDAIELYSLQMTRQGDELHIATIQLDEMAERLQALGIHSGLDSQILIWNAHNKEVLSNGQGSVSGYFPFYTVQIQWKEGSLSEAIDVRKNKRSHTHGVSPGNIS
jgi:hypothetical protein